MTQVIIIFHHVDTCIDMVMIITGTDALDVHFAL